jgi:uncharacterized membrane protein
MNKYFYTFLISMLPVIELRGGIPFGINAGIEPFEAMIICLIGNIIPVPFVMLFARDIMKWLKKKSPRFRDLITRYEKKTAKKAKKVNELKLLGLTLFVAVPLPGTGAWTGALIASMLEIRMKYAIPAIALGLVVAGLLITLGCIGIIAL